MTQPSSTPEQQHTPEPIQLADQPDELQADQAHRPVLTFMRRSSPLNTSQKQALEDYKHLIVEAPVHDARQLFEHPERPLTLEIGFGMGRSLVEMAKAAPMRNFLGIEVHIPGIAQCVYEAGTEGLTNLRVMEADAIEVLKGLPDGSIDRLQLYFPDPWQKKRHFKRRFVSHERMPLVEQKLAKGGWFHAATDWQPYAEWMQDVLDNRPALKNLYGKGNPAPRPEWRPLTKFERRGHEAGHGVWDFIFKKI
ncbi:tRNA (guanosine(46)-N7)-methyltransferase TrmB [Alkanindiges sp. WGS2144]|uniref:tRNA (guanosine(46)-N7)-methyltransferase TrmB n=1 Tax=Alkanindiges sp. WGS2144 TaxID=3366808 RepID=UPI0037517748